MAYNYNFDVYLTLAHVYFVFQLERTYSMPHSSFALTKLW